MCGRFTRFHTWSDIHGMYRLIDATETGRNIEARYNIAPTEDVLFVTAGENGAHKLRERRWWLVPAWAKDMPKGAMFNARLETADTSAAFKDAWKSKRCLVPADGFYEWTKNADDGGRDPWFIYQPGTAPFSFAGLWAHNDKLGVTSCTIITMPAGEPMTQLHDRQPAILAPDAYDAWLVGRLLELCRPPRRMRRTFPKFPWKASARSLPPHARVARPIRSLSAMRRRNLR